MKFNKEQSEAIFDRGNDLLLSASAGTGKTAVLIERVCNLIIEDKAKIDEFLIVTFTEAAALELKTRISERLNTAIDNREGDIKHLSSQITLLPSSNISTIHGFCKRLIEENFTYLEIEPDFKVADNSEMTLFKDESFEKVLAENVNNQDLLPAIEAFVKPQSFDNLKSIIMSIYSDAASSSNVQTFYQNLYKNTKKEKNVLADIQKQASFELKQITDLFASYLRYAESSNFDKYIDCYHSDTTKLLELEKILSFNNDFSIEDYQKVHELFKDFTFVTMPSARGKLKAEMDLDSADKFKSIRSQIKDKTNALINKYFKFSARQFELDIKNSREISLALIKFAEEFTKKYQEAKQKHNLIDFDDMQHFALKILEDDDIAENYKNLLQYIFVDEFQDTSDVQDALIERIKTTGSLFIVGDYKQSIYAFRKARPELFLKKYDDFTKSDTAKTIELNENFRSLPRILNSVNDVFKNLMKKNYGGIDYQTMAMLKSGKTIVNSDDIGKKTLINFVDKDRISEITKENPTLSSDEIYYKVMINRIKEITNETYPVFDEAGNVKEYKNYTFADICILSRSPNQKAGWIKKIFEENGIPLSIDIEENLFDVPEILTLLDFLKLVSNPKDDMALLSIMRSQIASFTDDELFELSNFDRTFYADFLDEDFREKAINKKGEALSNELKLKLEKLSGSIEKFRSSDHLSIRYRLENLISETKYLYHVLGKRGAYSTYHAIEDFLLYIDNFESSGKHGLFRLLEHFDELIKKGGILVYQSKMQNESESVKLLSIHKSKGLQFKYVIIQDIQKTFNRSYTDMIVLSEEAGLVSKNVYRDKGIGHANPLFYMVKDKKLAWEELEEMRLLYVAMTRAECRLEMFTKTKMNNYTLKTFKSDKKNIKNSNSYLDWILHSLEFKGILHDDYEGSKGKTYDLNINFDYHIADIEESLRSNAHKKMLDNETGIAGLVNHFNLITYPKQKGVSRKTVSQLKAKENKKAMIEYNISGKAGGVVRGNAYHKFMHIFIKSKLSLHEFIAINKEKRYISQAEIDLIDLDKIEQFCQDEIYNRIKKAKTLWLEKPFVLKKEINGELYHLQGIIDLAFLDNDGQIVILDYKTDSIKDEEQLMERYTTQLALYAEALSTITNCTVKEAYLYSFEIEKNILLNINHNIKKN